MSNKIQVIPQKLHLHILRVFLYSVFLLFIGCGTSINLSEYNPHILHKAPYMPSKQEVLNAKGAKIIVTDVDVSKLQLAQKANLASTMSAMIKQVFAKDKTAIVLERVEKLSYKQRVKEEIKLAELGAQSEDDVGQADYILRGKLSKATLSSNYYPGYYYYVYVDKKKVKRYAPPRRTYTACVGGFIKIFSLPQLEVKKSVGFDKCSIKTESGAGVYYAKSSDNGLMSNAAQRAIKQASYDLKNFFSKKGYIYQAKIKDEDIIVKVSLGKPFGAKEGEDVDIYSTTTETNPLTKQTHKIDVKIGEGRISNQLNDEYSWVIVDEIKEGKNLHLGDYVKIKYKAGFFDWL